MSGQFLTQYKKSLTISLCYLSMVYSLIFFLITDVSSQKVIKSCWFNDLKGANSQDIFKESKITNTVALRRVSVRLFAVWILQLWGEGRRRKIKKMKERVQERLKISIKLTTANLRRRKIFKSILKVSKFLNYKLQNYDWLLFSKTLDALHHRIIKIKGTNTVLLTFIIIQKRFNETFLSIPNFWLTAF